MDFAGMREPRLERVGGMPQGCRKVGSFSNGDRSYPRARNSPMATTAAGFATDDGNCQNFLQIGWREEKSTNFLIFKWFFKVIPRRMPVTPFFHTVFANYCPAADESCKEMRWNPLSRQFWLNLR
jgi:hypothetical protein